MPWPTEEVMSELRELYRERERLNRLLDRVLSKLGSKLREQPDYQKWLDGDGRIDNLPKWIHEVTGGRPLYYSQRPVVQREKKDRVPAEERDDYVESIFLKAREALTKGGRSESTGETPNDT